MIDPDDPIDPDAKIDPMAPRHAFYSAVRRVDGFELQRLGILQEANRRFFHPIGLSLGWLDDDDTVVVFDCRDLPEGDSFAPGFLDPDASKMRADYVDGEIASRAPRRLTVLGAVIQPLEHEQPPTAETIARRLHDARTRLDGTVTPWFSLTDDQRAALTAAAAEVVMPILAPGAR